MEKLIECVPNFSEGTNPNIIKTIADAMINADDSVKMINIHSDKDHNRSVFTLIGSPQSIQEAAFRGIEKAAACINLNNHIGTHPRIGAADVIPFIPLRNTSMEDCIKVARDVGKRVGEELNIPVFLYGQAAICQDHSNLSDIRRGEYEKLRLLIGTDRAHTPDYGPLYIGQAGASAIGARDILIAFNIYLDTTDLHYAKIIAKSIRESSGGLPYVKALGMLVNNKAQVSMNLMNYRKTSIQTVFTRVKELAEDYGIRLHHSELVGCLPLEAMDGIHTEDILLFDFSQDRILENHFSG